MLSAKVTWIGDTQFVTKMVRRAKQGEMEAAVFRPWEREVLQRDMLDMYKQGGDVHWAPNAPRTIEAKGHARPLLSARLFRFGTMVRSYQIIRKRKGLRAWDFEMTNRARSPKGFNYPAALHAGWEGKGNHPGYPPRPHLGFRTVSTQRLLDAAPRWVLEGRRYGT